MSPYRAPRRRITRERRRRPRPSAPVRADAKVAPSVAILDAAFRRAHRASAHGTSRLDRSRRNARLRIVRSSATVLRMMRGIGATATTPPLTELDRQILETHFPPGSLERSSRRLRTAEARIRRLLQDEEKQLATLSTEDQFGDLVRRTYGRLSSYVREIDPDLEQLQEIARFRKSRPQVLPGVPSVVVAGFPNVGKSSLVACLSSAKPEVAPYAFTTRAIVVGHTDLGFDRLQVVDTPGVLGRAGHANEAEREALAVVGALPSLILFVLDPSGTSGYPLGDQEQLLERWKVEFPKTPIIEVETKSDLTQTASSRLKVSAVTGTGITELRRVIEEKLARRPAAAVEPVPD